MVSKISMIITFYPALLNSITIEVMHTHILRQNIPLKTEMPFPETIFLLVWQRNKLQQLQNVQVRESIFCLVHNLHLARS